MSVAVPGTEQMLRGVPFGAAVGTAETAGANGANGVNGANCANGANGANGVNGANCANGGTGTGTGTGTAAGACGATHASGHSESGGTLGGAAGYGDVDESLAAALYQDGTGVGPGGGLEAGEPAESVAVALSRATDGDLLRAALVIAQRARQVDALRWGVVRELEARGRMVPLSESIARKAGFRNLTLLVATVFGVPTGAAGAWIKLCDNVAPRSSFTAGQLPAYRPALADALEAGELTLDQATAIDRTLPSPAGPEFAAGLHRAAERSLVDAARGFSPEGSGGGAGDGSGGAEADTDVDADEDDVAGEGRADEGASDLPAGAGALSRSGSTHWSLRNAPHLLKAQAEAWAGVIDPDGLEPSAKEQHRRRFFSLLQTTGGGWRISGYATAQDGAALQTLLDAYQAPRAQAGVAPGLASGHGKAPAAGGAPEGGGAPAGGGAPEGLREMRTREQIAYDVLISLVQAHARGPEAPTTGGAAPTLLITTTLAALRSHLASESAGGFLGNGNGNGGGRGNWAGNGDRLGRPAGNESRRNTATGSEPVTGIGLQAELERRFFLPARGDAPLPASLVSRMLCNDALQLLLTDDRGHPLRLGRKQRLFSPHQRRALIVRDRQCRAPGCSIPATWCEAHHVTPWHRGGSTDVDQGILLCSFHHHEVHADRLTIEDRPPGPGSPTPWRVISPIPEWAR